MKNYAYLFDKRYVQQSITHCVLYVNFATVRQEHQNDEVSDYSGGLKTKLVCTLTSALYIISLDELLIATLNRHGQPRSAIFMPIIYVGSFFQHQLNYIHHFRKRVILAAYARNQHE